MSRGVLETKKQNLSVLHTKLRIGMCCEQKHVESVLGTKNPKENERKSKKWWDPRLEGEVEGHKE
jgi:hypothetical protein